MRCCCPPDSAPACVEDLSVEPDALQHAAHLGHFARGRPHEIAQIVGGRVAVEPAHVDVVEHRQWFDQGRSLRDEGYIRRALSVQQAQKRRLAGPAASHHGDALAGTYRKVDIEKDGPAIVAGARPLQFEHDVPCHARQWRDGVGNVASWHRLHCQRLPDLVDKSGKLADLLDHLVVVVLRRNKFLPIKDGEQLGIVDAKDRGLQPGCEA